MVISASGCTVTNDFNDSDKTNNPSQNKTSASPKIIKACPIDVKVPPYKFKHNKVRLINDLSTEFYGDCNEDGTPKEGIVIFKQQGRPFVVNFLTKRGYYDFRDIILRKPKFIEYVKKIPGWCIKKDVDNRLQNAIVAGVCGSKEAGIGVTVAWDTGVRSYGRSEWFYASGQYAHDGDIHGYIEYIYMHPNDESKILAFGRGAQLDAHGGRVSEYCLGEHLDDLWKPENRVGWNGWNEVFSDGGPRECLKSLTKENKKFSKTQSLDLAQYFGNVVTATSELYGSAIASAAKKGGTSLNGLNYTSCSNISDMHLKRYCETGDCGQLSSFKNGRFVPLCEAKNSSHIPPGQTLDFYLKQYLDYGNADSYNLQNKTGMSYKNFKAFEKVASNPNLRTIMVILWLNNIKLELQ